MIEEIHRRHRWNVETQRRLDGHAYHDGNDRTEKDCEHCGLVKVTVHPPQGLPRREWRHWNGQTFVCEQTPPCVPTRAVSDVPMQVQVS